MEGVLVSVKKPGRPSRRRSSPISRVAIDSGPRLTPGQYAISSPVGYELEGRRAAEVGANGPVTADLRLRKTQDLAAQLTNAEWLASMPGTEDEKKCCSAACSATPRAHVRSTHDAAEF